MTDREGEIPSRPQGVWYAMSPGRTRSVFDFGFQDFDMYDVDSTRQQVTVNNETLILSPGTEFEDGSFATERSPDGHRLSRTPQISSQIRSGDSERLRPVP